MTDKQCAIEAIQKLPDTATWDDILADLQKLEAGLRDSDRGRTVRAG